MQADFTHKIKSKEFQVIQLQEQLASLESQAENKINEARQRMVRAEKSACERIEHEYNQILV